MNKTHLKTKSSEWRPMADGKKGADVEKPTPPPTKTIAIPR